LPLPADDYLFYAFNQIIEQNTYQWGVSGYNAVISACNGLPHKDVHVKPVKNILLIGPAGNVSRLFW
jgi:hypothetical protein